jgi:ABC-2 type transport system ATP-binding protein
MDPASRRRFWELIHELAAQQKTILVTTHYLDEAEYCNRLSLINRGRIVAEGTPAAVRGLARATALTVVCAPLNVGLAALLARPDLGEATIFGDSLRLVTPDPNKARAALPGLLADAEVRLEAVRDDEPTLEDVFVQLVQETNARA